MPPKPRKPPSKFEAKPPEARILQAARDEFATTGLAGARMRTIATKAGVNGALLHYYFRNKQGLYHSVLQDTISLVWGQMSEALSAIPADAHLEKKVSAVLHSYVGTLVANPLHMRMMLRELLEGGHHIATLFPTIQKNRWSPLMEIMKGFQKETQTGGLWPGCQPFHLLLNLMGMAFGSVLFTSVYPVLEKHIALPSPFEPDYPAKRVQHILAMIFPKSEDMR